MASQKETSGNAPNQIEKIDEDFKKKLHIGHAANLGGTEEPLQSACDNKIERPLKMTHQLKNKWAFWHLKSDRTKEWTECLHKVVDIETIEEFWVFYLKIVPAGDLPMGNDYYLFKDGIKPMWEEPKNVDGGRIVCITEKHTRSGKLDEWWIKLMLMLVCEAFEGFSDEICGAAIIIRNKGPDKLAIWTTNAEKEDENSRIAMILSDKLEIPPEYFHYELHKHSSQRSQFNGLVQMLKSPSVFNQPERA